MMQHTDRRGFLKGAAGVAAGVAVVGTSKARADVNDRIRMACIGVKGRGASHVSHFSSFPDVTVATICDVDANVVPPHIKAVEERTGKAPAFVQDLRRVFDDKSIDAVSIATPDHWHALAAIWAVQAGKHVYVEKPVSHNVREGRLMVEAARKHNKVMAVGTQSRSAEHCQKAVDLIRSGKLGQIYMARALCYKPRPSIGHKEDGPVPAGVDYDIWLGPAPERPFNANRFHYHWHWFWDYGTTDMGNQGIHEMDKARWGLGKQELPKAIHGMGGRFGYKDDGETPNTQVTTFEYDDCRLVFEVRGLPTHDESGIKVGNIFYGSEGCLVMDMGSGFRTYFGYKNEPGPSSKGSPDHDRLHKRNFIESVRSHVTPAADIEEGHLSSALCHLGNISYRLGRKLRFDPKAERFIGDAEADKLLTRTYRKPFVVPDPV